MARPSLATSKGVWRYRIGAYRFLAKIDDDKLIIFFIDRRN